MDLKITGKFIQECRKENGWTQAELADKISVSEKTVSKWECGNGFPDTSLMLPLCETLGITANELLSGKRLGEEEYKPKAEENLVDLKDKQLRLKKKMLASGVVLIVVAVLLSVACGCVVEFIPMALGWQIAIMVGAVGVLIASACIVLWVENSVGSYICKECGQSFVPSYGKMALAPHVGFTRRMKCPNCKKTTWCKKKFDD